METLTFIRKTGADIQALSDDFALLRIQVFREFPYLYDGTVAYEKEYIKTYSSAAEAMLFAVYDAGKMVGATTCIPLLNETAEVQAPFLQAGYNIEEICYFGESLLLPDYRGRGLGHRFFDEREAHARRSGHYRLTTFCAVNREADHPLRPADYRPNDDFWRKRGYEKNPALVCRMTWQDVQEEASGSKELTFWTKPL